MRVPLILFWDKGLRDKGIASPVGILGEVGSAHPTLGDISAHPTLGHPRQQHQPQHSAKHNQGIELGAAIFEVLQSFPGNQGDEAR